MTPEPLPLATPDGVSEVPEYNQHPHNFMSPQDLVDLEEIRKSQTNPPEGL